jgi:Undecaprenyl-phosphate glucose phosphotransferase
MLAEGSGLADTDRYSANDIPADGYPGGNGHLSWNFALDLWLVAELLYLAAVVMTLATNLGGAMAGTSHVVIAIGWIVVYALLAWYHRAIEAQVVRTDRLRQALVDWVKASVITLVGAFMLGDLVNAARFWVLATFVAGVVTITIVGALARSIIARKSRSGTLGDRIAIYGRTERTEALVAMIEGGAGPVARVHLVFDQRNRGGTGVISGMLPGNDFDEFIEQIKQRKIDTVIIDLPWSAGPRIDDLLECFEQISVNVSMAPLSLDFATAKQTVGYVGGRPTLSLYRSKITGLQAIAKIVFDRSAAAVALLILAVPLLLVGVIIKLDSQGPMLFRQKRRGMNNESFNMFKFRSMYIASADANADKLVTKSDSRVTRVGAIIRRTSIDELPQLVNVLFGQMSLVGPRPHAYGAKAADRLYEEVVRRYPARHRVLPGITGLAQVRGFRGNTEAEADIVKRVESDIEYIDRWTPALDIQIIARTAATFLFQTGAY